MKSLERLLPLNIATMSLTLFHPFVFEQLRGLSVNTNRTRKHHYLPFVIKKKHFFIKNNSSGASLVGQVARWRAKMFVFVAVE